MDKIANGGAAFPQLKYERVGEAAKGTAEEGMSLRDYFAAVALQGFLSGQPKSATVTSIAEWSYTIADAMLIQRTKP